MIIPTVGRKVWYRPSEAELNARGTMLVPQIHAIPGEPLDATIVAVFGDRLVNLVVFDAFGNHYKRINVVLKQDDDAVPSGEAFAEWMPYQIQSSKKEETTMAKKAAP